MNFFGTAQVATAPAPVFGFGATAAPTLTGGPLTSNTFGGFGFNTTAPTTGLFQQTAAVKPAGNVFGGFPTSSAPFQTFGATFPKSTATSIFAPTLPTSSGLQNVQSQPAFSFKLPQQPTPAFLPYQPAQTNVLTQPAATEPQANVDAFFASLCQPMLFGDERDVILARWNQLQAMWGTGLGYSALGPAAFTPDNTFARLKSVAYNVLPTSNDSDGIVCLYISLPFPEVTAQRQGLQDTLFRLLGGRPNLQLIIEEIRPCAEQSTTTEVIMKVLERQNTGNITNVAASELVRYFSGPTVAPQLQSQLSVCRLTAEVCPSVNQLSVFRENPPVGIDRLIWEQAHLDNPHPDKTIPVPLIGLADLRRRKQDQIAFSRQQSVILKHINSLVQEMKTGQLMLTQKVVQLKQKQVGLSHRVLEVFKRQELHRRSGFAISVEEEALRCGLERMWSELTSPQQGLRMRFQEASTALRANQSSEGSKISISSDGTGTGDHPAVTWNLDVESWCELKEYLSQRHTGIREMQHLLTELSATLKVMEEKNPVTAAGNKLAAVSKVSFAVNTRSR